MTQDISSLIAAAEQGDGSDAEALFSLLYATILIGRTMPRVTTDDGTQ